MSRSRRRIGKARSSPCRPQTLSSRAPECQRRALLPPPPARILRPFPDAGLPRDESSPGSLRREALLLPGPLSPPMNPACEPETCSAHSSGLCPAAPCKPLPQLPVPCQPSCPAIPGTRLTSITPGPFLPRGLRRVSRLCEFPGSSPQRCRRTRKPDRPYGIHNPHIPCCRSPVNPRLSAPAPFIMPGISTPGAPPAPLRSLRTPQAAAAPIRHGRAVMRSARGFCSESLPLPPDGSRNSPDPPHNRVAFPSPPVSRMLHEMPPAAPRRESPEEIPEIPKRANGGAPAPFPQKIKRDNGEEQGRQGGTENTGRQEEANDAIPPAAGTCHRTRAPGTESPRLRRERNAPWRKMLPL